MPHSKQKEPTSSECSDKGECLNCIFILGVRNLHQEYPENAHRSLKKLPEHWCYEDLCPRFGHHDIRAVAGLKILKARPGPARWYPKKSKPDSSSPCCFCPRPVCRRIWAHDRMESTAFPTLRQNRATGRATRACRGICWTTRRVLAGTSDRSFDPAIS